MKFCHSCGKKYTDQAVKCTYCGSPLEDHPSPLFDSAPSYSDKDPGFSNIGDKLQNLAKASAALSIVGGFILIILGISSRHAVDWTLIIVGIVLAISGFIGAWPLYGFGQLIETNQQMLEKMEQMERSIRIMANKK